MHIFSAFLDEIISVRSFCESNRLLDFRDPILLSCNDWFIDP